MSKQYYEIKSEASKDSADIYIYDQIGGSFWSEGVTAKQFVKDLKALDVKTINLHINSPGGSVFEAMAIYNALKDHPATVISNIDGLAASAATFVSLAGDTVKMAENAMFMIHNPWMATAGDSEQLRKDADILDKIRETMVSIYMDKYVGSQNDLIAALDAETWYSAQEALDAGFIDELKNELKAAAMFNPEVFSSLGFKHAPQMQTEVSEETQEETTNPTEGEQVSDTPVSAPTDTDAVEVQDKATPVAYTTPRSPINSMASYLEHKVKAHAGNEDSKQYVAAFESAKSKVDADAIKSATSTDNDGVLYPPVMQELVTTSIGTTAAIDAIGITPLVENGLKFYIPKATQYPTAGTTAEGDPASDTDMETDLIEVSVVKKAGKQKISFELFDRSSPSFWQEVQRQLGIALRKTKDEYLLARLTAEGTAATATAGTIAGLQSFIANETTEALLGSGDFADILLASGSWWSTIKGAKDTTGRSLYDAINPMNANGRGATPQSLRSTVEGMNLYVDPFFSTSGLVDDSAIIVGMDSARYWESPIRSVQVNNLSDGSIELEYYQYVAAKAIKPLGVRKFNLV